MGMLAAVDAEAMFATVFLAAFVGIPLLLTVSRAFTRG